MVSFAFNKKSTETKKKEPLSQTEDVEFITEFKEHNKESKKLKIFDDISTSKNSPKNPSKSKLQDFEFITEFKEHNEESKKRKFFDNTSTSKNSPKIPSKSKLQVLDFKNFTDDDFSPDVTAEDVVKLVKASYSKIKDFEYVPSNKKFGKQYIKKKYEKISHTVHHILKIDDYCRVKHEKYKGMFGRVVFVTDGSKCCRVNFYSGPTAMIHDYNLEKISHESYKQYIEDYEYNKRKTEKVVKNEIKEICIVEKPKLSNWLFSSLHVTVIDPNYKEGRYVGDCAVIEDVYNDDQCSCVTAKGSNLDCLNSAMLAPLRPAVEQRARVIGGPYKGSLVTVVEVNDDGVQVEVPFSDETWNIDMNLLCLCD